VKRPALPGRASQKVARLVSVNRRWASPGAARVGMPAPSAGPALRVCLQDQSSLLGAAIVTSGAGETSDPRRSGTTGGTG
jgi:hypothetical protein